MAVRNQKVNDRYAIYNCDTMDMLQELPDASVHFSIYSPPFGGMLYQYSSEPEDLSNCKDYDEFFMQYGFIVDQKYRVTLPGRISAVHCTDIYKPHGEVSELIDFPGHIIKCHEERGWKYIARIHIWKEPLTVRNRTMIKSLHHKTLCEDSTKVSIANADYLIIFRRDGSNAIPVDHKAGLLNYAGSQEVPQELLKWRGYEGHQINNEYSQWIWRNYASSNWHDIRIDRTLGNGASLYSMNRAEKEVDDEKHMHPLQLDVIERAVVLWSNPGETVLTPFLGIGSEVYGAVSLGRRGIGAELKTAYYQQALRNLETIPEAEEVQGNLLDFALDAQ